jgi:hypothetical protein
MTSTRPAPFGDYQLEIYLAGLHGTLPALPMAYAELEARAAQALSPSVLSYVAGGAGSEHTQRANASAFLRSILTETDLIMAVDGYPALADLTPDSLRVHAWWRTLLNSRE